MSSDRKEGCKPLQCKDIPDAPVLEFVRDSNRWCTWFGPDQIDGALAENSVLRAMPRGTPEKLGLAKMRQLIRRGLIKGCGCGCRGDFEISAKGEEFLRLISLMLLEMGKKMSAYIGSDTALETILFDMLFNARDERANIEIRLILKHGMVQQIESSKPTATWLDYGYEYERSIPGSKVVKHLKPRKKRTTKKRASKHQREGG